MSSLLSISLFCEPSKEAEAFVRLLHTRLFPRSSEISGFMYEGTTNVERKRPIPAIDDLDACMLGKRDNTSYHFRMMFSCESGCAVPIDAIVYGKSFDGGFPYRDCGPIRIIATINDLSRPLWELLRADLIPPSSSLEVVLSELVQRDIEDWFYTVCGVYDNYEDLSASIHHGVMYLEYGCPSPVGASMIYHRQLKNFLEDFQGIYKEYQFGTPGLSLYSPQSYNSELESSSINRIPYGKQHPSFFVQFDRPKGDNIFGFLDSLTSEAVIKIQSIPLEWASRWLSVYNESDSGIMFYRLNDNGILLVSTNPLMSLWKCYNSFYHEMLTKI